MRRVTSGLWQKAKIEKPSHSDASHPSKEKRGDLNHGGWHRERELSPPSTVQMLHNHEPIGLSI